MLKLARISSEEPSLVGLLSEATLRGQSVAQLPALMAHKAWTPAASQRVCTELANFNLPEEVAAELAAS